MSTAASIIEKYNLTYEHREEEMPITIFAETRYGCFYIRMGGDCRRSPSKGELLEALEISAAWREYSARHDLIKGRRGALFAVREQIGEDAFAAAMDCLQLPDYPKLVVREIEPSQSYTVNPFIGFMVVKDTRQY